MIARTLVRFKHPQWSRIGEKNWVVLQSVEELVWQAVELKNMPISGLAAIVLNFPDADTDFWAEIEWLDQ